MLVGGAGRPIVDPPGHLTDLGGRGRQGPGAANHRREWRSRPPTGSVPRRVWTISVGPSADGLSVERASLRRWGSIRVRRAPGCTAPPNSGVYRLECEQSSPPCRDRRRRGWARACPLRPASGFTSVARGPDRLTTKGPHAGASGGSRCNRSGSSRLGGEDARHRRRHCRTGADPQRGRHHRAFARRRCPLPRPAGGRWRHVAATANGVPRRWSGPEKQVARGRDRRG